MKWILNETLGYVEMYFVLNFQEVLSSRRLGRVCCLQHMERDCTMGKRTNPPRFTSSRAEWLENPPSVLMVRLN